MRDWIVGLQKGATERGEGLDPARWSELEVAGGLPIPEQLRDLYEAMDGADLPPDVVLFPFQGEDSVLSHRQDGRSEAGPGAWVFGRAGDKGLLYAARKEDLVIGEDRPDWLDPVGPGEWVFCWRKSDGSTRCYRTLEQLLTRLVPPVETEEVGDITYARALSAVQGALDSLGGEEEGEKTPAENGASGGRALVTTEAGGGAPKAKKAAAKRKAAPRKPGKKKAAVRRPKKKKAAVRKPKKKKAAAKRKAPAKKKGARRGR